MRAVIYARYSSDNQRDDSIDDHDHRMPSGHVGDQFRVVAATELDCSITRDQAKKSLFLQVAEGLRRRLRVGHG